MEFSFTKPHPVEADDEDECSNADVASVIGKQAESIVDFYGAPTKKKKNNECDDDDDEEGSEMEEVDDYPGEEDDLLDLNDDVDEKYGKSLQIERLLKDQDNFNTKKKSLEPREEFSDNVRITFDENNELGTITFMNPYINYQKQIDIIVARNPETKATFFDHKITSEWDMNKMARLRKKLAKEKPRRDEFLKMGEKKLRACFERGRFKKVEGIQSNVYIDTYSPPVDLDFCGTDFDNLDLRDERRTHTKDGAQNMELTLEDDASQSADAEIDIDDVGDDNVEDSDIESPEETAVQDETPTQDQNNLPVDSAREDSIEGNLSDMDLTLSDLTPKQAEDGPDEDAMSTASDLDFPVSDELKELQKLTKMPNEILKILCAAFEEEIDLERTEEDGSSEAVGEIGKEIEEDDKLEEDSENETLEEAEEEDSDPEEETDENELNNNNEKDTHNREDVSSTTGSVLSEIQNTVSVATNQQPPPASVVQPPLGPEQENKIFLGCLGISREQLPNARIVWVPTSEIENHYRQFDNHLSRMAFAPDGTRLMSNEQLLRTLMGATPEQNNSPMDPST